MTRNEARVAYLKKWAQANYDRGADYMVECWEHDDYVEALEDSDWNLDTAIGQIQDVIEVRKDRAAEAAYQRRQSR